jgi:hypothetical protein
MSYFVIDEEHMKESVKKTRDHRDEKNPHFGHVMQPVSRDAIASKQRLRYDLMRSALEQSKNSVSEERVRQVVQEEIEKFLNETLYNNKANIPIEL